MTKINKVRFNEFLKKFPVVDLPVTIGEGTHLEFSRINDPLPQQMIDQFILSQGEPEPDEFTEFIPCFRLKKSEEFVAIVYWIGALLDYQYIMLTFNRKGVEIDRSVIAGTKVIGNSLLTSVATIDEELIIYIAAGEADAHTNQFDANSSKSFSLEILPNGEIISE